MWNQAKPLSVPNLYDIDATEGQINEMGATPDRIEIDTSDPTMGQAWQDQLTALDARLAALTEQGNVHVQVDRAEGLSY